MLRKRDGMVVEERQADGSMAAVQKQMNVPPCIRPGMSLVYIPGESRMDVEGVTDSIQLPKGSMVWEVAGSPVVSTGDEVVRDSDKMTGS